MTSVFETTDELRAALDTCTDPHLREVLAGRLRQRERADRAGGVFALLPATADEEI